MILYSTLGVCLSKVSLCCVWKEGLLVGWLVPFSFSREVVESRCLFVCVWWWFVACVNSYCTASSSYHGIIPDYSTIQ